MGYSSFAPKSQGLSPAGGEVAVVVRVVQVHVPAGVDAAVARGGLKLRGGPARQAVGLARVSTTLLSASGSGAVVVAAAAEDAPRGLRVVVAGGDGGPQVEPIAHQSADVLSISISAAHACRWRSWR